MRQNLFLIERQDDQTFYARQRLGGGHVVGFQDGEMSSVKAK
ncbi:hypothetical protein AGMMS49960_21970 [Betaproteobacteria bacterium]|nr:hypothetical protein AGMMS49543_28190 [Betaproteobacteria bacterium]GHU05529.1 hypothetical protein AGMMS49960_21970 [Betaproteobacteria bacterium]GHU15183.1 hypothetical protein AGMMS50225_28260 [Betaproteobacteria bacterium]